MTLLERSEKPRATGPLAFSCAVHAVLLFWVAEGPAVRLPKASDSEYKQIVEGKQARVVWYRAKNLPAVAPVEAVKPNVRVRAEITADQQMVATAKSAPLRDRTVLSPAPELDVAPLDAPNVIAVRLPPKQFVAPSPVPPPVPDSPSLAPDAPQLTPAEPIPLEKLAVKLPPKPFQAPAPPVPSKPVSTTALAEPPQIDAARLQVSKSIAPRLFIPPRSQAAPPPSQIRMPQDAPLLADARTVGGIAPALSGRPLPRAAKGPEAPPEVAVSPVGGNSAPLDLAIIGVRPVDALPPSSPPSRPANLAAGPNVNPKGADADGSTNGIPLPGLFVKAPVPPKSDLLAQAYAAANAAPTAPETMRAALKRLPSGVPVVGESAHSPTGARVSSAPDPRFNGRDVYMMAIQMPNLTSASGSWLMWYSESAARSAGLAPISPPVAHRKVDPKYLPTAVEEHVEGTVRLFCTIGLDGNVSGIEIVQGADRRLEQSAIAALAKWEFYPATRNGQPIAVDLVVEIPFRLLPRAPKR